MKPSDQLTDARTHEDCQREHEIGDFGEYCPASDLWIFGPYDEEDDG